MRNGESWKFGKGLIDGGIFRLLPAFHTRPSGAPSPRERAFDLFNKFQFIELLSFAVRTIICLPLWGMCPVRTLGGGGENRPNFKSFTTPQSKIKDFRQLPAGNPVAALTAHRTVIHYRDCATLTPDKGNRWVRGSLTTVR